MKSLLAATAIAAMLVGPAFAGECPTRVQKAEEALKTATFDDAKKTKITEHIAQAKSEHDAGKHDASLVTLKDTFQLLGIM